ncbi:MAG: hypothetical protein U1F53_03640 [Burkholderiaceae bacterium]
MIASQSMGRKALVTGEDCAGSAPRVPIRAHPATPRPARLSENARFATRTGTRAMDIERINTIGTTLADLTQRTLDLRGYL